MAQTHMFMCALIAGWGGTVAATAAVAEPPTLIQNVLVFDGERSLGQRSVLIDAGKIADPDFKGKPKPGTRIVDGKGKTLLPGLIDGHVHAFAGLDTPLLFGVTTQMDMFMPPQATKEARAATKRGTNLAVADLYSAGYLATVPKGHGTQFGSPVPTLTSPAEADAWVAARVAEGSDYIKIVNEPGTSFGAKLPTLDSATIKALIIAAHKRGKLAVVHVQNLDAATDAVNSGADGLVHLFSDKDGGMAFAQLAKARGVFITPTYTVFEAFAGRAGSAALLDHPGLTGLLPKSAVETVKQSFGPDRSSTLDATESANIGALLKAGVPILAGTDSGNPGTYYGISMHRELELLVKAGLTPIQALTAATAAPAMAYRLADRGRIAKGLKADLLLVDGDPTVTITATRNIVEIWKGGQSANPLRVIRRRELAKIASGGYPPVALPADGRIASFATVAGKVEIKSPFGLGWTTNTDAIMGGGSTVTTSVAGTAPGGQTVLQMKGDVKPGAFAQWAGVAFNPAAAQFGPTNLSPAKALRLWVRGQGAGFGVMGFSEKGGQRPALAKMPVTADWSEVTVKFSEMQGFDGSAATMLLIGALQPGAYTLEIADVRLITE
jgi:imidazolonepropionase-like amidohydrolase